MSAPDRSIRPAGEAPLLRLQQVGRHYPLPRRWPWEAGAMQTVLDGVDLQVRPGRHLGLVGASGSGKSTLARLVMGLEPPSRGRIELLGHDLATLGPRALRALRPAWQMVFQDPYGSLDPRLPVARSLAEPLLAVPGLDRTQRAARVAEMIEAVGLSSDDLRKRPHAFSGGQRQRIAIARALVSRPRLVVADEALSALDLSVQAQVLNLLMDLAERYAVTYLFISHDLAVVRHLCHEVAVLHAGQVVEQGAPAALWRAPQHPATQALVEAAGLNAATGHPALGEAAGRGAQPLAHNAPPDLRSER